MSMLKLKRHVFFKKFYVQQLLMIHFNVFYVLGFDFDVVQITLQIPFMLHGLSVLIVIYMIYLVFICYCRRFYIR